MELMEESLREIGNSNLDRSDGTVAASESGEVPSTPSMVYTDVTVVPEHDNEASVPAISSFQDCVFLKGSCIPLSLPISHIIMNVWPDAPNCFILAADISALRAKQRSLDVKRREALDRILDIKGNGGSKFAPSSGRCPSLVWYFAGSIRVFCRVRTSPLMDNKKMMAPISTGPEKIAVRSVGTKKEFNVDKVFPQDSTQGKIFGMLVLVCRCWHLIFYTK